MIKLECQIDNQGMIAGILVKKVVTFSSIFKYPQTINEGPRVIPNQNK